MPFIFDQQHFADRNAWHIGTDLELELTTIGVSAQRRFPALAVHVHVYRRPFFYLINVALPTGLFALLGIVLLCLPINFPPSRLVYELTLTLTIVTYKLAMSSSMPQVTYLTSLDKYQLSCAAIILFAVFETAILGTQFEVGVHTLPAFLGWIDWASTGILGTAWLLLNLWWLRLIACATRRRQDIYDAAKRAELRAEVKEEVTEHKLYTRRSKSTNVLADTFVNIPDVSKPSSQNSFELPEMGQAPGPRWVSRARCGSCSNSGSSG